ncbi:MAG TPA: 1,4-dihydroxy-2-naphthoate polyprenyltransferase [Chitinophagales bacterium]|nr:1,4-dihydroxy-2-naphthoate polyprenyltransferase [Chitinophagales bacterium]
MTKVQSWLYAFRLRTLPLAFSSIITGSSIAFAENREGFKPVVFVLLLVTTLLLQILSNLANDYGDSEKGTDNDERIGPKRAVQQGLLSFAEIKTGIVVTVILSLIAGITLIYLATQGLNIGYGIFFFILGLGAIAAAIKYTVGKGAYGYMGLGDVFVLLFFGIVGVGGSYYLLAHNFNATVLLPAFTIGAFASGVLNLNNMRDRESDAKAGKNSLVVKIGGENAKKYHTALIITGFIAAVAYVVLNFTSTMQFMFILTAILFRKHLAAVWKIDNPVEFDPLLKQLAIGTFIFSMLFAVGIIVGAAA